MPADKAAAVCREKNECIAAALPVKERQSLSHSIE
jgi:hypothetical protein